MSAKAPRVVRAERFELVDAEGNLRARIGPRTRRIGGETIRSTSIELLGDDGKPLFNVSTSSDGSSELVLASDGGGEVRLWSGFRGRERRGQAGVAINAAQAMAAAEHRVVANEGSMPATWNSGPSLDPWLKEAPYVADAVTLHKVLEHARYRVEHLQIQAAARREEGDRSAARRYVGQARRLERLMEETQRRFDEQRGAAG